MERTSRRAWQATAGVEDVDVKIARVLFWLHWRPAPFCRAVLFAESASRTPTEDEDIQVLGLFIHGIAGKMMIST